MTAMRMIVGASVKTTVDTMVEIPAIPMKRSVNLYVFLIYGMDDLKWKSLTNIT
jgi:hypothetical protein